MAIRDSLLTYAAALAYQSRFWQSRLASRLSQKAIIGFHFFSFPIFGHMSRPKYQKIRGIFFKRHQIEWNTVWKAQQVVNTKCLLILSKNMWSILMTLKIRLFEEILRCNMKHSQQNDMNNCYLQSELSSMCKSKVKAIQCPRGTSISQYKSKLSPQLTQGSKYPGEVMEPYP